MKVSAENADWSREKIRSFWDPSRKLLGSIRSYQYWKNKKSIFSYFFRGLATLRHKFWSAVSGADFPLETKIGGGLLLPHPNGLVIHPSAEIGVNCLLFQQVTLGVGNKPGLPILEGHVDVGAGAKILGGVRIGAHAVIGANAVVVSDVPSGKTARGVPAKIF